MNKDIEYWLNLYIAFNPQVKSSKKKKKKSVDFVYTISFATPSQN